MVQTKKLFFVIAILFLANSVFGWTEGQSFSQNELDTLDIDSQHLGCQQEGIRIRLGADTNQRSLQVFHSCLALRKTRNPLRPYLVFRTPQRLIQEWYVETILTCLRNFGFQSCVMELRSQLLNSHNDFRLEIRKRAQDFQTNSIPPGFGNNFVFGEDQLNQ